MIMDREKIEQGKRCRETGELSKAEEIFKGILARDPENEQAWFEMGNVAHMRGDLGNAARYYRAALRINPANGWAAGELAKVLTLSNDLDGAREFCEKALTVQPENAALKVELGKVYRLRGRCAESLALFKEALSIDPGRADLRDFVARSGEVKDFRAETLPYRVFITWGMHYACNYSCAYCYTPRPGTAACKRGGEKYAARYPGTKDVIKAWEKVRERYGACRIRLDGGEPSAYPDFLNLAAALSGIHRLQVNTNLSFDVPAFVKAMDPGRVRVDASLHSEYTQLDGFAGKIERLKDNGFKVVVSFVAYPPFINRIPACRERFAAMQVPFIIHPFSGRYDGTAYPAGYTEEENKRIYTLDKASDTERTWRTVHQDRAQTRDGGPKSGETGMTDDAVPAEREPDAPAHGGPVRECRMGQMYARIYPNGDAYRCCTGDGLSPLGNLFDGSFTLLDKPEPCDHPGCRCWRCMTPGDEKRWLHTWLDEWEMPR